MNSNLLRDHSDIMDATGHGTQFKIDVRNISGTGNGFSNGRVELYYEAAGSRAASCHEA